MRPLSHLGERRRGLRRIREGALSADVTPTNPPAPTKLVPLYGHPMWTTDDLDHAEYDLPFPAPGVFLRAYVWACGDEVCDCHQPRIERCTPRGRFWNIETVWEGEFHSEPSSDEWAAQREELIAECNLRKIPPGVSREQ